MLLRNTYSILLGIPSRRLCTEGGAKLNIPLASSLAAMIIVALGVPYTETSPGGNDRNYSNLLFRKKHCTENDSQ